MPKKRLAIVATHPTQHFVPIYVDLSSRSNIELKVFFLAENGVKSYQDTGFGVDIIWGFPILEGYEYEFLEKGKIAKQFSFFEMDSKRLIPALDEFKPDVVWVHGYSCRANWRAICWKKGKVKKLYTSDSNLSDSRRWWKKLFKHLIVSWFFKQCDAFISIGENNTNYLKHYGVQEKKIHNSAFPIDMQRLINYRNMLSTKDRNQLRDHYAIPKNSTLLLFSGKLVSYKRPVDIVLALAELKNLNVYILFMGDGELKNELLAVANRLGISDRVKISGFVNQDKIAGYMHAADILVLSSEKEPFGAVVSEALPFGLPVIVSNRVGSIGSSAIVGKNALVYECGKTGQLADHIRCLHSDKKRYKDMSNAALNLTWKHDKKVISDTITGIL